MSSPNHQASPSPPPAAQESRKRDASQMAESPEEPEWAPVDPEFNFSAKNKQDKPGSFNRILNVGGVDFYVLTPQLALHSGFFQGIFFPPNQGSGYRETNQERVSLTGCEAATFQYILELIGGGNRLSDSNVRDVLHVANMWLFGGVVEKCEQFLKEKSEFDQMFKMDLAREYRLEQLKTHLLNSVKNIRDLDATIPEDVNGFDKPTLDMVTMHTLGLLGIHRPRQAPVPAGEAVGDAGNVPPVDPRAAPANPPAGPVVRPDPFEFFHQAARPAAPVRDMQNELGGLRERIEGLRQRAARVVVPEPAPVQDDVMVDVVINLE